jgi:hypothetical protein
MFDTCDDLITQIDNWLGNRTELQSIYPSFVMLAEQRMYRRLRCREMIERATSLLNEEYEFLPFNFLTVQAVFASPGTQTNTAFRRTRLTGMTVGQLEVNYRDQQAALPESYAIVGNQIRFGPVPSPSSPPLPPQITEPALYRNFEITYYMRFPRIYPGPSSSNPSNAILQVYPELYLYGALIEAEPYLIDDERIMVWKSMYEEALTDINNASQSGALSAPAVGVG